MSLIGGWNNMPDRRALDEALELTEMEQLAVYRAVEELVKNRLAKARRVQKIEKSRRRRDRKQGLYPPPRLYGLTERVVKVGEGAGRM